MDQNQNILLSSGVRKAGVVVLSLLALFLLAKSVNEFKTYGVIGKDVAASNTITVTGKGEVVKEPDIATFAFGSTAESLSVAEAQDKSAKAINAIKDFLTQNGVAEKDIKTTNYNIYPRYNWEDATYMRPGRQVLAAYVVSQMVEVKVRKLADAGKLIGGLGELGATDISGLSFGFDKEEVVKSEARNLAVIEAKKQAEAIANSLGVSLGRVVSFNESGEPYYPRAYGMGGADMMKLDSAASMPPITGGESKVISNVTITYELK
ncbi:MAG: hypothetical protein A3C72_01150 [Candidatus Taylorbacteria bacterium RIFCSPHIGHO2_02_FULL_43_32b]|uniref:SIMPL domain-containing protein n=1 Tax=Candidatus Taylorbacteria bacterium RIFCSPHIGHO2_02_FULL_43_32b TaxID=1802306 RepID=A0A1G2ME37_9BACT|nr:MAG: hypothetical protein A2743_03830 [Candidatus Taylorbacteria bacterium RIFCSPHIGHO2_01_FULL_43_47]OHA21984.1 MAG: hypothetical protein A3C72_01150 [Candidatus Taylorbacteria bacterium RIFCSPHIGHO2_02_FULL_43_32b]